MRATKTRRFRGACAAFAAAAVVSLTPRVASADEPRYRVELHAAAHLPNCNDLDGFIGVLELALERSLLGSTASRVLDVQITRPGAYSVDVAIKELDGRVLSKTTNAYPGSTECFKVLHKTALVAAVEMEKDLGNEPEEEPEPAPSTSTPEQCPTLPAQPPVVCPAQKEPPAEKPPVIAPPPKRGFVGLGVGAFWNVAPEAFFAPHLRVGWYVRPRAVLELDLTGQAWMTATPLDVPPAIDVKTGLATLASCYAPGPFLLCGLVSTELRHTANAEQDPETMLLPSIGLRAGYELSLVRSLSLRTNLDTFVYLRDRTIEGRTETFWQPIPIALGVSTALVWTY